MKEKLTIAISGAGGFIGKSLTDYFLDATDYPLILSYFNVTDIPQSILNNKRCTLIVGDLNNENVCSNIIENADILIHLAQSVSPQFNFGSWQEAYKNTCSSTVALIDLLRKRKKPLHIIYPSSGGTVYSNKINQEKLPHSENSPIMPVSPYGIQKVMFENYFSLLNSVHPNITVNVLRISNPYGTILPKDRAQGFIGIALSKIKNNETIEIWGNINSTRDYIHLKDLNRAFECALDYKNGCQIFNIGSGVGTSLKYLLDLFSDLLREKIDYKIIEMATENYFPDWNVLDITKAKTYLNWSPEISIEEGVQSIVEKVLSN